ncbi:UPF0678 fatty acid-binding protein-like protein At1g79260 [Amborella trichopoda]|uniref:UPF0678 fatty acid-binding protein-like protein At1g79260 n=1 Tax=Amborella trichopoda TaxID=13333 RepID=UPI0005D45F7C|nr:UPF0678 fatty acid-binding protein-like protein At1g79260 [Amborella trichopoda]|eukprot:XP_011621062.1 UPF0678 fatty acid-binding protein-like protein At1g79260 [Amborella trichopoda]
MDDRWGQAIENLTKALEEINQRLQRLENDVIRVEQMMHWLDQRLQWLENSLPHEEEQPVIAYAQKTWKLASGENMHAESGYWRPKVDGSIEVVIAQSTGLVEVQKGTYDAEKKMVQLQSELIGNATKVREITRTFEFISGELVYFVQMATNSTTLQPHLRGLLKKI